MEDSEEEIYIAKTHKKRQIVVEDDEEEPV
jgi:hypothetical protein